MPENQATAATQFAQRLFPVVVVCFLLSGMTGLLYEVIWGRYLSLFIGASTHAHTAVLATFMGGLALGNHIFGKRADRQTDALLGLYAWLELGIGVYCLLFPTLFPLLSDLYVVLGTAAGPDSFLILPLKLTLGAIAILLPTTLMGGTLPVLARFLTRSSQEIGSKVGMLYFINTAGAVAGCFLGGFVVVEAFGLELGMILAAALNIAIGFFFLGLQKRWQTVVGKVKAGDDDTETKDEGPGTRFVYTERQVKWTVVVIAISGGLTMLYELVWIRLVALVFGSSSQSFSIMLMAFIAGIAIGGAVVSRLLRKDRDALFLLALCELGVAASVLLVMPFYERLPFVFASMRELLSDSDGAYAVMLGLQIGLLMLLMIVPTTLIGMTLPLATRVAITRLDALGRGVGYVFSMNTLGTLIGASLSGLVIIPALGMQPSLFLGVASSVGLGLALLFVLDRWPRPRLAAIAAASVALIGAFILFGGQWDYRVLAAGLFQKSAEGLPDTFDEFKGGFTASELLFAEDGLDTTVTVTERGGVRFLKVNSKTDASSSKADMITQMMLGHLPMLIHPGDPKEVFIVGLGSGVTAGAILRHPDSKVMVAELSRAVVDGARFFEDINHKVLDDPRMTLRLGDAKDNLLLDDRRYDIIISEPSNPWISGIANLFTVEFFEDAYKKLGDDGLMVQWLQFYNLDDALISRVINTLTRVFPHVTLWRFSASDLMLVAAKQPFNIDPDSLSARLAIPAVAADLGDPEKIALREPIDLMLYQAMSNPAVRRSFPGQDPINSDYRPNLEFAAPRALFKRAKPTIVQRLDERTQARTGNGLDIARHLGAATLDKRSLIEVSHAVRRSGSPKLATGLELAVRGSGGDRLMEDVLRSGDASLLVEPLADKALASGSPTLRDCQSLAPALSAQLIRRSSVFWTPKTDRFDRFIAACATAHPPLAARLHVLRAETCTTLGHLESVIDATERATASDPPPGDNIAVLRLKARALLGLGRRAEAIKAFEALLALAPRDAEALHVLKSLAGR